MVGQSEAQMRSTLPAGGCSTAIRHVEWRPVFWARITRRGGAVGYQRRSQQGTACCWWGQISFYCGGSSISARLVSIAGPRLSLPKQGVGCDSGRALCIYGHHAQRPELHVACKCWTQAQYLHNSRCAQCGSNKNRVRPALQAEYRPHPWLLVCYWYVRERAS